MFQVKQALSDADVCVALRPDWEKAHFRRGMALEAGMEAGPHTQPPDCFLVACRCTRTHSLHPPPAAAVAYRSTTRKQSGAGMSG